MERQRAKAAAVAYEVPGLQGNALYRADDAPRASVNIMADKRVARGSTFSVSVVPPVRGEGGDGPPDRDREQRALVLTTAQTRNLPCAERRRGGRTKTA